jgi:hypothetical protein
LVDHFSLLCFVLVRFPQPTMIHLCEHGAPFPNLMVLKSVFQCTSILWIPKLFNIPHPHKTFCFLCELNNWIHNHCKILNETSINCTIPLNTWIYNEFCGICIYYINSLHLCVRLSVTRQFCCKSILWQNRPLYNFGTASRGGGETHVIHRSRRHP